ncbi:DNA cytosine methyltransferase [Nitratidesulfovibrio termitidis]|uniref:DNA cytosine methyltransferase n=1 Tax=Nitratidesulfovibrio termitidis TaxID=42252 RepID=UPI000A01C566|nr:DNA cytosine methyltransferase [Nitratidesulfovibrio termitidis]
MSLAYQALQYSLSYSTSSQPEADVRPSFLEFFAGSGLVSHALARHFRGVWANDICPKKAAVFWSNHEGAPFDLCSIADVSGKRLPPAVLSWASFPCQDLSLAGNGEGIRAKRSGLVWEWLRVMDEMRLRPPLLAAENVVGLVASDEGAHYRELHKALAERGYNVGALLLDAVQWLPQSRPRVFVVAIDARVRIPKELSAAKPTWAHSSAIQRAATGLENWIWWNLPKPGPRAQTLSEIVDFSLPCQDATTCKKNLALIPPAHMQRLLESRLAVVPGYKRIRNKKQVLELRFDDIAGCLRTPAGGSSRQYLVIRHGTGWRTRILSPREAARLMGAPETFKLPGTFNDGYRAMGDAVAAPVAAHLATHLLSPLAAACNDHT